MAQIRAVSRSVPILTMMNERTCKPHSSFPGQILWVAVWISFPLAAVAPVAKAEAPKAKVSLLADVEAITAGQSFDLGVRFQLDEGWHIYWQNSGDSGFPPGTAWTLPDGFSVAAPQFPVPQRHLSEGDIITNILPGEPMLIVKATAPASMADAKAMIAAKVNYLVCNVNCIIEKADLSLELPVGAPGVEAKKANEAEFNRARRSLPKTNSKYVRLIPTFSPKKVSAGSAVELSLGVEIGPGFHIQSHEPLTKGLIAADVFIERREGLRFQRPVYPRPKIRPDKTLGQLSEYDGAITIRAAGQVDASRAPGPVDLPGIFTFQACDEKGNCFPPETLAFSAPIEVLAAGSTPSGGAPISTTAPPNEAVESGPSDAGGIEGSLKKFGLVGLLFGCFLYGLAINATPCVLPLLSIKVLGFVQQAHESRKRTLVLGLSFGAGVMIFFVLLGFLAAGGDNILQYTAAIIALPAIVLAMALSMLGVYTLQVPAAATELDARIQKEGPLSSFGKGALAPVLGFACTGPLLAGAFSWATKQEPQIAVLAFLFSGLGMASPYMLLGANPNWLSFLPRPGNWMITFERIMGFLLLAMVIYLLSPVAHRMGAEGLQWTLAFFVAIGMACWLLGKIDFSMSAFTRWKYRTSAVGLVAVCGFGVYGWALNPKVEVMIPWRPWSPAAVEAAVRDGKTVFVDFTADYCTNCKVNKKVAILTREFLEKLNALKADAFQADYSTGDEVIKGVLDRFERPGVPLNLIYPAGKFDRPIVLEPLFSKATLLEKMDQAGPSKPAEVSRAGP